MKVDLPAQKMNLWRHSGQTDSNLASSSIGRLHTRQAFEGGRLNAAWPDNK
jgi:hypothetical protein